ncbi:unnamed protein product, partial [Phaeothamnion confervicola]
HEAGRAGGQAAKGGGGGGRHGEGGSGLKHEREHAGSVSGSLAAGVDHKILYLSPVVLRHQMERLLITRGDEAMSVGWMRRHRRHLFWNVVWYATRLGIPIPLRQSAATDVREIVIVGTD